MAATGPSKTVFVGNVPYNMGEEQLIEVFKSAGQVVGFRLVFDRDTGKPKGYGFCEFSDHETALSAVRNLNNVDVGGRNLRIDLAESDPFLEGKTTVRGELMDSGLPASGDVSNDPNAFLADIPPGAPVPPGSTVLDMISTTLADMDPAVLIEVLAQTKAFVITHPEQARMLLVAHPQFGYAIFQALLLNKIVDPGVLERMLAASSGSAGASGAPPIVPPPTFQAPIPHPYGAAPPMAAPPPAGYPGPPMPPFFRPPPGPVVQPPPSQPTPTPQTPENLTSEQQHAMVMQVLSLTPEQINALPDAERAAIQQLRSQFLAPRGSAPP
ncbi:hypothetical protein C8J56DRAFT_925911 [Mycena floridula]|nr:hypothetical protein C8J56DRAFT_925911 [Mycena floridula]